MSPPIEPMLAKSVPAIPLAPGMSYEPKWDGFRCVVFRDGPEVELASRGRKTLTRYFPEVVGFCQPALPERCVVDGELVAIVDGALDFDTLSQRIHPADSRVRMLAEKTPASFVAFDLLAIGDEDLTGLPFSERRARLEQAIPGGGPVYLTPATTDAELAARWFARFEGAGLDGLIAKPAGIGYEPGKRLMFKIKHARTADVVVAGYRLHKDGAGVGSLLLGLYQDGRLHHVGVCSSFSAARRKELLTELAPYENPATHPWFDPSTGQRVPGGPSRWQAVAKDWVPLRPELVCEVGYDHMENKERFRHVAQFARWRPDREPESCTWEQLDEPVSFDVASVLAGRP